MRGSKSTPLTSTISGFIEDGFSEVSELAEEMRSWADALEEKFSATPKYEEVSSAADALESVEAPEVPEVASEFACTCTVDTRKGLARRDRLSNALSKLGAAKDAVENLMSDLNSEEDELASIDERDEDQKDRMAEITDQLVELEELLSDLDNAIGELEGVEFPGMYS